MVKVAIAGASGKLALEVIEKLADAGKHEILGLVRKPQDPSSLPQFEGVKYIQTSYQEENELVEILTGVETVLSFIVAHTDPNAETAKRLIDASIKAGVKRFAPSEWATNNKLADVVEYTSWYANKLEVKKYLEDVNKSKKVIEYSLFQPGAFMNYLAYPHQTVKHYRIDYATFIDFENTRAFFLEGSENAELSVTSIEDIAEVTALAVDYKGEWPIVGGITGQRVTIGELIRLGEKYRGKPFEIDRLKLEDLKAGVVKTDFFPPIEVPGIPEEHREQFTDVLVIGATISVAEGAWATSNEWNKLLPDFKPTTVEEYLQKTWGSQ
ncbi:hypothetical protein CORC01_01090 [Colletotrichum orchidophilum]|uniref:NmrA-like domain-containing protein n=1 Tax=Colletotrichum orchidophilum TaxID=1209926 RepID=A0A1G4BQQ0_9PEZI|nr:uncharacterized protein CORC01_01090 [Colletotrichum orchidophilum]OHF03771.1 hypothetical protein CORC01_01090 [Colletotrichum orchidophilum]